MEQQLFIRSLGSNSNTQQKGSLFKIHSQVFVMWLITSFHHFFTLSGSLFGLLLLAVIGQSVKLKIYMLPFSSLKEGGTPWCLRN